MGTCFKIQYIVHMALASFVRDGQLPTFTNDLFHCNFHAEQNVKGESRNGMYRISANSFRGNYSFLSVALFTVTFDLYFINLNSCRGNYSREETIQGRKLFAEIRYLS